MGYVPLLFSVFSVPSVVNNQPNFVPCQPPHFDAIALTEAQARQFHSRRLR